MPSWKKVITSGSNASLNSLYAPHITGSLLGTSSYAIYAETASVSLATTENRIIVMNKSGATITKGMVVHLTGSNNSSDTPYVITASYESDSLSANTLGIAYQTITDNNTGYVVTEGVLTGITVTGFVSGQILYLGATGSIIGTAPTAPFHSVRLGQVVRDSPSNNGSIYVRIDNGYELGELHDVKDTTTTSSYGDLLVKSGSVWLNSKQLTGSYAITGSLTATSFTGSLFGTASYATQALSSSFALTTTSASYALNATTATTASYVLNAVSSSFASTASFVNTLNQTVLITGSLTVGANSIGASENTLTLGPRDNGSEGGQLMLQAPGGTYTSASMWDNYTNLTRLLRGSNAGSDAVVASFNMHTKQMQLPAYNSTSAFPGSAAAFLAVDSSGNLITTSSAGGGGGGVTINNNVDNYVITATGVLNTLNGESNLQFNGTSLTITGQITSSGAIISQANGAMYFRGGDDAEFWDINLANHVGIYGQQDATVASIKLGSGGGIISGKNSNIGINTISPSASLDVIGSTRITGSLQITGSFSVQDSIDSSNKWLIGLGAMPGTTSTAVDWNSRVLYDTTGTTTSIDWQTRTLANSTGINNVDWENRYLYGPGPIPTSTEIAVDWNARQLSNSNGNIILDWGDSSPQFSGTASFATSASWAPGGGASFPYTGSAEITGSLGVTGSFSVLDSIDATNKILIGSGLVPGSTANSVNWDSRTLFDTNGNFSIRWGNLRTMYDANVSASIDWNNRQLKDANGIDIVNWQSGISITGSNITTGSVEVTGSFKVQDSIDSSNKWLIGPGGIPGSTATAVAWSDRQLLNSSGATIVNWETGVFTGTATSASFAATASFINPLNQSMVITGSLRGQVSALSILSNTASVDMVTNNFFTLTLANGASTNINPTNINPGQTVNILVTQGSAGTGTVTFPSLVKQASGSLYTGSAVANAVDIVTMIAFDATNVYVSSVRNMI